MRGKKIYGASQVLACPFCGNRATAKNSSGLPVCHHHLKENMVLKCVCGQMLDVRDGKYGTFFLCENCGPINYKKALGINGLPLPSVDDL